MKNIYQLYVQNGNRCPLIVKRGNWGKTAFVVESIAGNCFGPLPGVPPYHGNPVVKGRYINPDTGEEIPDRSGKCGELNNCGSYQWEII